MGQVACTGKTINKYRVCINEPEGKRTLQQHKQGHNIKVNLKGKERDSIDSIKLDHERREWWALVNRVMDLFF